MRTYLKSIRDSAFEDTITTTDVIFRSLAEGNRYTFTHLFEGVDSEDTVSIFAELPETAENPVTVSTRQITASGATKGTAYAFVTQDTAGTESDSRNDKFSPDEMPSSEVDWEVGGEYSDLGQGIDLYVPGGRTAGQRSGGTGIAAFGYVEPGVNMLWELSPEGNDVDILFKVVYSESTVVNS